MPTPAIDWQADFRGRHILITGGTSGIGAAIAQAFRDSGAQVVACAAATDELQAARQSPAFAGIRIEAVDVTQPQQIAALVDSLPRIDALVCSAGLTLKDREATEEGFDYVLDVNLKGSYRAAMACLPALAQQQGSVVFIASVLAYMGSGRIPAYTASKGAIRSLTQALACRFAPQGVRVNAIAPGWTETPLSAQSRQSEAFNQTIVARTPLGRWAQPQEMADPVLFLCSQAARFITGVTLPVDGGYTAQGN